MSPQSHTLSHTLLSALLTEALPTLLLPPVVQHLPKSPGLVARAPQTHVPEL